MHSPILRRLKLLKSLPIGCTHSPLLDQAIAEEEIRDYAARGESLGGRTTLGDPSEGRCRFSGVLCRWFVVMTEKRCSSFDEHPLTRRLYCPPLRATINA